MSPIYKTLKQYDRALSDFSKAIELDPRFARLYSSRADVLLTLGRKGKAVDDYWKSLIIDPDHLDADYTRSQIEKLKT